VSQAKNPNPQPTAFSDLFKVGIGSSSSHTIGPMRAACEFAGRLGGRAVSGVRVTLYGSLAWTGQGHQTDKAVVLGLAGHEPATVDPDEMGRLWGEVTERRRLRLGGGQEIGFDPATGIVFNRERALPRHPNALRCEAFGAAGELLADEVYYSVGGGFVEREGAEARAAGEQLAAPHPYATAAELLELAAAAELTIAELVLENEAARGGREAALERVDHIITVMLASIERGLNATGDLPGGLNLPRRARDIYRQIDGKGPRAPHEVMDYVSAFAIAVNEENAAGGRIVTAPTCGAAGVLPATLRYYLEFCPGATQDGARVLVLAATAIGDLIKRNASISGAEVGCQGEVGSAASMAAGGLAAALGATNEQIENAAEIAMEHHLGMTCDPVAGLVQIPCIERNAFGALKAIYAASLALRGDGTHHVSLDNAIETMRQTGLDMKDRYRETSLGGLAVNVPAC